MQNNKRILVRQWQLVRVLQATRFGLRIEQLVEQLSCSRATVYRDLRALEEAGVPISKDITNGEARYRLLREHELPALGLNPLQVTALVLARAQLAPLAGTGLADELDTLISRFRPAPPQQTFRFAASSPAPSATHAEVMRCIARSLASRRRLRIQYQSASRAGKIARLHVEPLLINVANQHAYLRGYCHERGAERTYKIARIKHIELTAEPFTHVPEAPPAAAFAHSVKAWGGSPGIVKAKLDPEVAWLAGEYPLIDGQKVALNPDGSATIEANVSGIVEAMRWILSWGGAAEAVAPAELRNVLESELSKALARYRRPGLARAPGGRATRRRNKVSRAS